MSDPLRRLPVYLVLDCSGSMAGEPIEAVRQGVKALLLDLRMDPQALESAYLSVITFSSVADQVCPLTELPSFVEPPLTANGTTAMGGALRLLQQSIEREVRKPGPSGKGDWKPLVFLMTDGQPTDSWEDAADVIRERRLNIIACAAGSGADAGKLRRVVGSEGTVVQLNDLQPETLKAFFRWVSSSIKTTSHKVSPADEGLTLPPPPREVLPVP